MKKFKLLSLSIILVINQIRYFFKNVLKKKRYFLPDINPEVMEGRLLMFS